MLNSSKNINKQFFKTISKGYKMQQLHFYTGAGPSTPSGIKACIFGANSNMGYRIASALLPNGIPTVLCHRNTLDVFCPIGDDPTYTKSNPYGTFPEFAINYDTVSMVIYYINL